MGIESNFFKRPGGPLQGKPIEDPSGQWHDQFGEKVEDPRKNQPDDKDVDYAQKFWEKGQPKGLREVMIENIQHSIKSGEKEGSFGIFAGPNGFEERDLQKMSAYRALARELGYEVGQFQYDKKTFVAAAKITKIEK